VKFTSVFGDDFDGAAAEAPLRGRIQIVPNRSPAHLPMAFNLRMDESSGQ